MHPILSICIPTHGVVDFVIPAVKSIYAQNCSLSDFEVVISDNGSSDDLKIALEQESYPNLLYQKVDASGFMNEVNSTKNAKGAFVKIMNHKSMLLPGVLQQMIDFVKANMEKKPMLFFSNGHVGKEQIINCPDFQSFMRKVSFWSSWEEGLGFWQEEKERLADIPYNEMVPTSSVLFYLRDESEYVIFNTPISTQKNMKRKRMYDFFEVFAIQYNDYYNKLRMEKKISTDTFNFLRYDMYRRYLISYYYQIVVAKTDDSIPLPHIKEQMSVYYTKWHYWWMVFYANTVMRIR